MPGRIRMWHNLRPDSNGDATWIRNVARDWVVRARAGGRRVGRNATRWLTRRWQDQQERLLARDFAYARNRCAPPETASTEAQAPFVSVVVLNRNGVSHLERFFSSFAETLHYPNVELVLVDHASRDESRDVIRDWSERLPVTLLAYGQNYSFAYSNNQAARHAHGELVLFANNDIVFTGDVLGPMARLLEAPGVGLVGAPLVYPPDHLDYPERVQHLGIKFAWDPSTAWVRPYNVGAGSGVELTAGGKERFPAVTAALMMCRRDVFLSLGGFDERYEYGLEDVDLALRYRRQRHEHAATISAPRSIHNESVTQRRDSGKEVGRRQQRNQRQFRRAWGYVLSREMAVDRIRNEAQLADAQLTIGLAVRQAGEDSPYGDTFTALELGDALKRRRDCRIRYLERGPDWYDGRGLDVVIALLDDYDPRSIHHASPNLITVAWCRNWFERWVSRPGFSFFDIILCSSTRSAQWVREHGAKDVRVFPLATNWDAFSSAEPRASYRADVCFAGNRREEPREIERALFGGATGVDLAIYGSGWEQVPHLARNYRGFVRYREMPSVYASSRLVVDDASRVKKPWASVNSRVFDALAAGRLVVTNGELGALELFGKELPTYRDAVSLRARIDRFLEAPDEAQALAARLGSVVKEHHTYAHRAATLLEWLGAWVESPRRVEILGRPLATRLEEARCAFEYDLQDELNRHGYSAAVRTSQGTNDRTAWGGEVSLAVGSPHSDWEKERPEQIRVVVLRGVVREIDQSHWGGVDAVIGHSSLLRQLTAFPGIERVVMEDEGPTSVARLVDQTVARVHATRVGVAPRLLPALAQAEPGCQKRGRK